MGNDGGSIPKRSELVKEAAKALTTAQIKEAQTEQQEYAWSTDPLSRKPLARPVVSDAAGVLYNKDSIIEFLLKEDGDAEKAEMKKIGGVKDSELGTFGDRVKGLKDVVEIKFEVEDAEAGAKGSSEKWKCPITGERLGAGSKAVYIVPCGHAFAGSVIKEIDERACLTVSLLPNSEAPSRDVTNTNGSNKQTVQRALRRKRRHSHPPHRPNRHCAPQSTPENAEGKGSYTCAEEGTRQQQKEAQAR